jgi:murein DD-endopeptidase MepM/ murein hydrolase activator NlpD
MIYSGVDETPGERRSLWSTKPGGHPSAIGVAFTCVLTLAPSLSLAEPAQSAETAIMPPVSPACVSSPFGPRSLPGRPLAGRFHNGIDISAPVGARVNAVSPGSIIRIQRHGVGGLEMLIQHQGFIGVYSHLGLIAPVIAEGRRAVLRGERIATVGRSGLTYGPHLYFGMIMDGQPVDPSPYLHIAPCGTSAQGASEPDLRPGREFVATSD